MNRYIVHVTPNVCGCDTHEPLLANSPEEAEDIAEDIAHDHYNSYGLLDNEEEDGVEVEIDYGVYLYNPEDHDMYSMSGSFEEEFLEIESGLV